MESKEVIFTEKGRKRLDELLGDQPDVHSRSYAKKLIKNGQVKVNEFIVTKSGLLLKDGDIIIYKHILEDKIRVSGEPIPLDIIFEDDDVLVLSKPAGIVVHPGAGNITGTLAAGVVNYLGGASKGLDPTRPGIVHRLDKDTSGVLIVAKNLTSQSYLGDLFKSRRIKKMYKVLVYGKVKEREGTIKTLIGRHKVDRQKMAVTDAESRGRTAITHFSVDSYYELKEDPTRLFTLLNVDLKTGRTHQIRVHMKKLGHPVVGDSLYTGRKMIREYPVADRQLLHSYSLELILPGGREKKFVSPLPKDFLDYLSRLHKIG